ncbi:MAG: hypothetical protein IJU03_13005 [Thermoguttaceae bacterium]|nr:hypothetical protein [Thermoguttaceae bacterium]
MTNNKQARNATRGNADENTGGRLIDDMGFLERLEAGLVTEEERREFAMELIADDDARARYLTMHEMGLFGENVEDESGEEFETETENQAAFEIETDTELEAPTANVNKTDKVAPTAKNSFSRFLPWVASAAVLLIAVGVYFNPSPSNLPKPDAPTTPATSNFQPGELSLGKWYALNGASLLKGLGVRKIDDADLESMTDGQRFQYIVEAITPDPKGALTNPEAARKAYDACSEAAKESGDGKLLLGLVEFDSNRYEEAERSFRAAADAYEKSGDELMREEARFNLATTLVSQSFDSTVGDEQIREVKKREAKSIYESLSQSYRAKLPLEIQKELEDVDSSLK